MRGPCTGVPGELVGLDVVADAQTRGHRRHRWGTDIHAGHGNAADDALHTPFSLRDRAGLRCRLCAHRHTIGTAERKNGRKPETPASAQAQVVPVIVLQHHRARQPRDRAAEFECLVGTHDTHAVDRSRCGADAAIDRAGLTGGLTCHGHCIGISCGDLLREFEGAAGVQVQVIGPVVLQDDCARKASHLATDHI
ncbi:hypothetical protein D9M72_503710 [compost metagenome]